MRSVYFKGICPEAPIHDTTTTCSKIATVTSHSFHKFRLNFSLSDKTVVYFNDFC